MNTGHGYRFVKFGREGLEALIAELRSGGWKVIGPAIRDGAIVYDEVETTAELPEGWTDEQQAGSYRLRRSGEGELFGFNVGPYSWKRFLHPPVARLWRAERKDGGFRIVPEREEPERLAFLGVRACELRAIEIQDLVFLEGGQVDSIYAGRRGNCFLIAVNCGRAGGTCFCESMGTGPRAVSGFDIALTEVVEPGAHYFIAEAGTVRGDEMLGRVEARDGGEADELKIADISARAAAEMGRSLDTDGIRDLFYRSHDDPRWDDAASRCLACTNCTLVCPTCFCTTVEDTTDLSGTRAERRRRWDSCFATDFSYIHGGSIRVSTKSRYRQWLTHKLASWQDQFGTSGCVGCGRCITWCPAGIDITEEAGAIRRGGPVEPTKEQ